MRQFFWDFIGDSIAKYAMYPGTDTSKNTSQETNFWRELSLFLKHKLCASSTHNKQAPCYMHLCTL